MAVRLRDPERGMSLMIVLLVMMLLSAIMIGFMANIMADTRSGGVDRDETQAYATAHAGMEKLTSDLAALFNTDYSPNGTQISAVAAKVPSMSGFTYVDPDGSSGYKIQYTAKIAGVNTLV
jgi:Tfp pilus assembly protein PilX